MIFDTTCYNQALLRCDVIEDELLKCTGINIFKVALETESWHTKRVITVSSSKQQLLVISEGVVVSEMVMEIVTLLVFALGDIGGEDRTWLKCNVDHHLEHIDCVVLDAMSFKEGALLIVVHGHVTTRHLNHAVVDGFIGVLDGLKVSILEGKKGS